MANKSASNLSRNAAYFRERSACYEKAYKSLLEAIGNYASDNPCVDMTPLGALAGDITARLNYQLEKAEMMRTRP